MRHRLLVPALVLALAGSALALWQRAPTVGAPAEPRRADTAKEDETPIGPKWWPSEWGADDQRGAANRLTAEKVLEAKALIKTGKVYQLGRDYENGMPNPGKRHFSLTIPGRPTGVHEGKNKMVHNDELVSGEIDRKSTRLNSSHLGIS